MLVESNKLSWGWGAGALAGAVKPSQQNLLDNEEIQKPAGHSKTTNQSNGGDS